MTGIKKDPKSVVNLGVGTYEEMPRCPVQLSNELAVTGGEFEVRTLRQFLTGAQASPGSKLPMVLGTVVWPKRPPFVWIPFGAVRIGSPVVIWMIDTWSILEMDGYCPSKRPPASCGAKHGNDGGTLATKVF